MRPNRGPDPPLPTALPYSPSWPGRRSLAAACRWARSEPCEQAKISIRQLAQAAGVSNPYLSQVERGLRRPSADILQQIAKGLRISAEALYVQAGILDDKPGETTVTDAIK